MMTTSGYAPVNGLSMYYEIHGTGRPLVLVQLTQRAELVVPIVERFLDQGC